VLCIFSVNHFVAAVAKVVPCEHRIQDVLVRVEPYYKWLGTAAADVSQTHVPHDGRLVDSVTVQYEPKALDYIMRTPELKTEIEQRLEQVRCLISWPKSRDDSLELKFQGTAGQKHPARDWADKCQTQMDKFLSDIKCETVDVLQEIWNDFKTQVKECTMQLNFMVKYEFVDDHCDLHFVGKKDASEKFRTTIESIKSSLEEELKKKHERITETLTTLSHHQLMILCLCNYADEVAAAVEGVKVVITQNEVHMTGMPNDVKRAKVKIYEKVAQLQSDMIAVSKAQGELMQKESVKLHLLECFRHRQVVASWSVRDNELSLYAFSTDQLTKAKEIIQSIVIEKEIPLDESSQALMSQQKWKEFEDQLTAEHEMFVVYKGKEGVLVLCCVNECSGAVQEKVQDFIEKNSTVQKLQSMMRPMADFLEQIMPSDLEKVSSTLTQRGGHMKRAGEDGEAGFVLTGNRSSVEWASNELIKLTETVAMFDHLIDRPGVPEYLMSTAGTAIVSDLQRRHQVVIDLESGSTPLQAAAAAAGTARGEAVFKYSRKVIVMISLSHCCCFVSTFSYILKQAILY